MSANTTSTRLRVASNAGAGYEPGPRNGVPEGPTGILKQNEGKMQTGLAYTENANGRSEEHTSELQSQSNLVCRLLLEKKKQSRKRTMKTASRTGVSSTKQLI